LTSADDTTVISAANFGSIEMLQSSLTTAISEVNQWGTANKLPLTESETKVLTVTGKRLSTRIVMTLLLLLLMESSLKMSNVQSFWA